MTHQFENLRRRVLPPEVCIYHHGCTDGYMSAVIVKSRYPGCVLVPMSYWQPLDDEIIRGRRVLVVDFCLFGDDLEALRRGSASYVVLDHHETSEPIDDEFVVCDRSMSGVTLTWDFVHPGVDRPDVLKYIEDYDTWRHRFGASHDIVAALRGYPYEVEAWSRLLHAPASSLAQEGAILRRAARSRADSVRETMRLIPFAGWDAVPVFNCVRDYPALDLLAEEFAGEHPFVVFWYQRGDGSIKYSVRSRESSPSFVNSAFIAACYGGGGHDGSAGFRSHAFPDALPSVRADGFDQTARDLWDMRDRSASTATHIAWLKDRVAVPGP